MFASLLLPCGTNGLEAPYLWVLYKQVTHFTPDEVVFIAPEEYFRDPDAFFTTDRWDISLAGQEHTHFQVPTAEELGRYRHQDLPRDWLDELELREGSNDERMRYVLTCKIPRLEEALRAAIADLVGREKVEAILTWCNVPSLSAVAAEFGLPVVHHELGPLRGPQYHWTAYLDFRGVNGNAEACARFATFCAEPEATTLPVLSKRELRALMMVDPAIGDFSVSPKYECGVPLQVENDSNMIAFSRGWNNQRLIEAASMAHGEEQTLVRRHPAGLHDYPDSFGVIDDSPNAFEFILRCKKIVTINSSVGLEAILLERDACILGDSPCAFLAHNSFDAAEPPLPDAVRLRALNFVLLGYLMPFEFLFDSEYLRWRLRGPTETEIYRFHLDYLQTRARLHLDRQRFRGIAGNLLEDGLLHFALSYSAKTRCLSRQAIELADQLTELRRSRDIALAEISNMKNSHSWRLTAPLRALRELTARILSRSHLGRPH